MEILQPAQLSFLTIYNPSLGRSDETLHDQVVYYHSAKDTSRNSEQNANATVHDERNERLRQIGLAQGMVEFAKAFSDGAPVDSIDSEKSRIVLHELEPGWWMLASVDLTHIRHAPKHARSKSDAHVEPKEEFSAREVAPQELLLQQLLRAQSIFLIHHAASLQDLYVRLSREKFCGVLGIYWDRFVSCWDVLLHGNPAVDIFNGVKLAAGGELGIGVGEEEWGSGEREVLEGFIGRTEGLVDLVVTRFGNEASDTQPRWLGMGQMPSVDDGVVFSGIGALTRPALRALSAWLETVYQYGGMAYGVTDNPQSTRRRRRRKPPPLDADKRGRPNDAIAASQPQSPPTQGPRTPNIPPPIVPAATESLAAAVRKADNNADTNNNGPGSPTEPSAADTLVKYMTLGVYGSSWGIPAGRPRSASRTVESKDPSASPTRRDKTARRPNGESGEFDSEQGCFVVGLRGSLTDEHELSDPSASEGASDDWDRRILVRTVHLERTPEPPSASVASPTTPETPYYERHRIVVYARRPFLFTFIFANNTPTLAYTSLYRSLHHQLGPLQRPLLNSTAPSQARARLHAALPHPPRPAAGTNGDAPIYDVLWKPEALTVLASLPSIPEPAPGAPGVAGRRWLAAAMGSSTGATTPPGARDASPSSGAGGASNPPPWTRRDALHVHSHVLHMVAATRRRGNAREQLLQTGRGWWVAWLRVLAEAPRPVDNDAATADGRPHASPSVAHEAILIRRAALDARRSGSGAVGATGSPARGTGVGGWIGWGGGAAETTVTAGNGPSDGLGVDVARYVDGLVTLRR